MPAGIRPVLSRYQLPGSTSVSVQTVPVPIEAGTASIPVTRSASSIGGGRLPGLGPEAVLAGDNGPQTGRRTAGAPGFGLGPAEAGAGGGAPGGGVPRAPAQTGGAGGAAR